MNSIVSCFKAYTSINLVIRIILGVILGVLIGLCAKYNFVGSQDTLVGLSSIIGNLFVSALRAVAPILVFVLIASSILLKEFNNASGFKNVIFLYILGTFLAACVGVAAAMLFPTEIHIANLAELTKNSPPKTPASLSVVLKNLLLNITDNPIRAIANGNYIGILAWSIGFGVTLRFCSQETKNFFSDLSNSITKITQFIIQFAPLGVMGLVAMSIYETGSEGLISYGKVVILLVCAMAFVALIINPIITWFYIRKNPYPLVLTCLKESGITAFFTRSSAANIPINLNLCKKLNLDEEIYSVSIPLGATINMGGAATVISILALCTAHTLGIEVSFFSSVLLCLVATIGACGASGIAGGSLMLIPLACSLFGIQQDIAIQVVAIGVMIGVIQDSLETAINSSTDVLFTAISSHKTGTDIKGI